MKILERQKPYYSLNAFNDALFVNSTAGLVPPARKRADRRGSAARHHCDDSKTSFRGVKRVFKRTADDSSYVRFFVPAGCGSEIS